VYEKVVGKRGKGAGKRAKKEYPSLQIPTRREAERIP
jgi:hypothetical protein